MRNDRQRKALVPHMWYTTLFYMTKGKSSIPDIAAEIARLLNDAGFTVRKLREAGFSTRTAESLLGKGDYLPGLESADTALKLVGHELWHRKQR